MSLEDLKSLRDAKVSELRRLRNTRSVPVFIQEQIDKKRADAQRLIYEAQALEDELNSLNERIPALHDEIEVLALRILSLETASKLDQLRRLVEKQYALEQS